MPPSAANEAAYVLTYIPFRSKLHLWLHNTHTKTRWDVLFLQALTPGFPASEAITGHGDYKKVQHRNFIVTENY